ncbi:hypothetical protein [Streptomyces mexicanus]|uniref:hypothetical protein n=1 Tax=Streptomyces mexicanus TaxID=178566 RepID=UPI003668451B
MTDRLSSEREAEIAEHLATTKNWSIGNLATRDLLAELAAVRAERDQAYDNLAGANLARWEEEQDNSRLRLALQSAQRGRRRLRTELAKYVGKEPTIAEEMAYLSHCLDAVLDLCDDAERQATRWENPLPVPEWVAKVRAAAEGMVPRRSYPPALPWARLMDDEDLWDFLAELAGAAAGRSVVPSAQDALSEIEDTCARWRAIAEAQHAHNTAPGPSADAPADGITRRIAPMQALREGGERDA